MANSVAKLQTTLTELGRQIEASVDGLHTIRARTSRVLRATSAFSTLAGEVRSLRRRLSEPALAAQLLRDEADRAAFQEELHLYIDQLESYRHTYAEELSLATPRRAPPQPPWWRVFERRRRSVRPGS